MREHVLLVDDDEFARNLAQTILERAGFNVHVAGNVAEAINDFDLQNPTAVVTDWHLPDGDGADLAKRLHERCKRSLPVILITGDRNPALDDAHDQFSTVLHKPYLPSALERAIRSALS